jgi:hypothetical protein
MRSLCAREDSACYSGPSHTAMAAAVVCNDSAARLNACHRAKMRVLLLHIGKLLLFTSECYAGPGGCLQACHLDTQSCSMAELREGICCAG